MVWEQGLESRYFHEDYDLRGKNVYIPRRTVAKKTVLPAMILRDRPIQPFIPNNRSKPALLVLVLIVLQLYMMR